MCVHASIWSGIYNWGNGELLSLIMKAFGVFPFSDERRNFY
jgi:hypothetical protein